MDPGPVADLGWRSQYQAMHARLEQDFLDAYVLMLTDLARGQPAPIVPARAYMPTDPSCWRAPQPQEGRDSPWLTQHLTNLLL